MVKDDIVALSIMIQIYRHIKYPMTEQYRRAVRTAPGGSYHTAKWITQSRILSVLKDDHRVCLWPWSHLHLFTLEGLKNSHFLGAPWYKKDQEAFYSISIKCGYYSPLKYLQILMWKIRLLIIKNRAQSCTHHITSNTFFKSLQNIHQNINNDFLRLVNLKFILFFCLHFFVFSKFSKMITHF